MNNLANERTDRHVMRQVDWNWIRTQSSYIKYWITIKKALFLSEDGDMDCRQQTAGIASQTTR